MHATIRPPIIYQTFMLCMLVLFFLLPGTRVISFPLNLIGILVFVFGANMALSAKKAFKATDTPMMPSETAGKLHCDGYFKFSRNPMYLGIAIGLLGFAVLFSSAVNFAFPVLFVVLMDLFYIRHEEQLLVQAFGDEYVQYTRRVRRWF